MGKGIASEFKARQPEMFDAYKRICGRHLLEPGKLWLWKGTDFWTLNFPTKKHWRNPSRVEWIEAGLRKFVLHYKSLGIDEISFPRLGCGNGGLDWHEVRPLMERYLAPLPIQVYIHDYMVDVGLPEHMEAVAQELRSRSPSPKTFDGFVAAIFNAVSLANNRLTDIQSCEPINASIADDLLKLRLSDHEDVLDKEDLRGVWLGLQNGLLTKERAGWANMESGPAMLSILSLLPYVRPIEIQRGDGEPEIAIEMRRATGSEPVVSDFGKKAQLEMAWR
jgi:hypothetical protein